MATLRVFGDARLRSAHVSDVLGLGPTSAFEAGSPVSRRSIATRQHSGWLLKSNHNPEQDVELAESIGKVLALVEPVSERLWQLSGEGYTVDWFCYLGTSPAEHAVKLDRSTLERLLALPGDLVIDSFSDDE